jgi:ubiquinone/menaquinone biosynthesis C-methylase UbiE
MINLVIYSLKRFAWFKRLNAKITYEILAKRIPVAQWQFMNYGYVPNENDVPLQSSVDTSMQKYPLLMYHCLATKACIEGKQVLEVGSGRGGGAKYIAQYLNPASYIGMDLAQSAVDLASKLHVLPNLKFIQGSAESIPFPDNSFDVIINVESCHAYGSVSKFLKEAERVLKPDGYLLLVDFRSGGKKNMDLLRDQITDTGMQIIKEENINENVLMAIEAEDKNKKAQIENLIPRRWQKLFAEFAGVVGSKFYNTLKNKDRLYHRFVVKKVA